MSANFHRDPKTFEPIPNAHDELSTPEDWWKNPPQTLDERLRILKARKRHIRRPTREGRELRALFQRVEQEAQTLKQQANKFDPLYLALPSFEQSLILNSYLYGITFPMVFTANRIGKTAAGILNFLLWVFPNNPNYSLFQKRKDHLGRDCTCYPRPEYQMVSRIQEALKNRPSHIPDPIPTQPPSHPQNQKVLQWLQNELPVDTFLPVYPSPPWDQGGRVWFCAPDKSKIKSEFWPEWKRWLPAQSILRYSEYDMEIVFQTPRLQSLPSPSERGAGAGSSLPRTVWTITGKSFESEEEKFASGAVDAIHITEGIPPGHFKEIKLRFKDPGLGFWDYTPYESVNTGSRTKLAWDVFHNREETPLNRYVFTKFRLQDAPDYIASKKKKADLERSFRGDPEGKARLDGEFYTTSGLVLSHLDRSTHLLSWTKEELFKHFPTAQIYRGFDPGLDHPTAAAWAALLPTNQLVVYRMFSERGLVIRDRATKIINLSGNTRIWIPFKKAKDPRTQGYFREAHPNPYPQSEIVQATFADYHVFKKDENTGLPYAQHYIQQGLVLRESVHDSPERRCEVLDDSLIPSPFLPDLRTNKPPGARIYFLKNEPGVMAAFLKWEEYFWDRFRSGDKKGQPKDKVPDIDDDELDAVCYINSARIRWTNIRPHAILPESYITEPEHESLQQLQNIGTSSGSVIFGDLNTVQDDDDDN